MSARTACPQIDFGMLREMRLSMRSFPISSQSAAFEGEAFSRSSKFCSISARCRARKSGAYSPRRNPYTAEERVRLVRAMASRGPELAARDGGKTRQALRLRPQRRLSECCELVVDPARVLRIALDHQTGVDH